MAWLDLILPLIILPLLTRLLPRAGATDWRWHIDLPLTILSGVLLVGIGGLWLSGFPKYEAPDVYPTADFLEYCGSLVAADLEKWSLWSHNRSRLPAVPALFAMPYLGVVDALLFGSMVARVQQ